jgi:hypothetical protein
MLNIGQSAVLDLLMPLPVMDEQKPLPSSSDAETARLDALAAEATRAIALLKERRSALISAAVTGKIDVRNALQNRKPAMREGLSHRIVAFIANLLPIYTHALIDDRHCARSLIDGTLILPLEEPEEDEEGWVEVHWQGDPARRTEVQGIHGKYRRRPIRRNHRSSRLGNNQSKLRPSCSALHHKTGAFLALKNRTRRAPSPKC